jgi:hypothetical protein
MRSIKALFILAVFIGELTKPLLSISGSRSRVFDGLTESYKSCNRLFFSMRFLVAINSEFCLIRISAV